ncbi:ComF family protein [Citricoccus muralis]|uniref:Putative amidophosphoribosyltransferase n=1 Tax=Citricoccus muralis TaxID=169134 RepID=A0A3D9LBD9_9MICC|nr:phosphoribosyltransferase family protein [Citricoccus muralis]REE03472.1 putative amidophosphoribosyltransferase [Citricoccus muralis]
MRLPSGCAVGLDRLVLAPAARALGRSGRELAGLLMPSLCVLCGRQDGTVCPECAPGLVAELLHPFRAEQDAAALPLYPVPLGGPEPSLHPVPVVAAARYGAEASRALLAFKDHGRTAVAGYLRPAVHRALAAAPRLLEAQGPFTLVPVPSSAAGFRARGYDPVEELLTGALPPGWQVAPGWLAHRRRPLVAAFRPRSSHAGTGSRQRRHRGRDRFRTSRRYAANAQRGPGRNVVVFDDVMTTGSTLAATWHALEQDGVRPVGAVVVAAVTAPGTAPDEGLNSA